MFAAVRANPCPFRVWFSLESLLLLKGFLKHVQGWLSLFGSPNPKP